MAATSLATQSNGIGLIFGYNVIPNMYINHTVSTGWTNEKTSTIQNLIINDQNQSNPGTSGLTLTSPGSFTIGQVTSGGGNIDFQCGTVTVAPLATFVTYRLISEISCVTSTMVSLSFKG